MEAAKSHHSGSGQASVRAHPATGVGGPQAFFASRRGFLPEIPRILPPGETNPPCGLRRALLPALSNRKPGPRRARPTPPNSRVDRGDLGLLPEPPECRSGGSGRRSPSPSANDRENLASSWFTLGAAMTSSKVRLAEKRLRTSSRLAPTSASRGGDGAARRPRRGAHAAAARRPRRSL